jgi:hypothetical protein
MAAGTGCRGPLAGIAERHVSDLHTLACERTLPRSILSYRRNSAGRGKPYCFHAEAVAAQPRNFVSPVSFNRSEE